MITNIKSEENDMRLKELTSDIIIRKEDITKDGSRYIYTMTAKDNNIVPGLGIMLYSIRIEMTDEFGITTSAEIRDIFSNLAKAEAFFEKLVRNLATPMNLIYVLEDEMS